MAFNYSGQFSPSSLSVNKSENVKWFSRCSKASNGSYLLLQESTRDDSRHVGASQRTCKSGSVFWNTCLRAISKGSSSDRNENSRNPSERLRQNVLIVSAMSVMTAFLALLGVVTYSFKSSLQRGE